MPADPSTWFLQFTSTDPAAPEGDGRPWGDGTEMAGRASAPGGPREPWDEGCAVDALVGGYAAMSAMRDGLEQALAEAKAAAASGAPVGSRGRVYVTDWRLNFMRDLSEANPWSLGPWGAYVEGTQAKHDLTVVGLVLQLLKAGVLVRILLWCPIAASTANDLGPHISDHFHTTKIVAAADAAWGTPPSADQLGVAALDLRTADRLTASHHQKTLVIRGAQTSVAFVGGVDLAYTRRDAPMGQGDWQSGAKIPDPTLGWPHAPDESGVDYSPLAKVKAYGDRQKSDLPIEIYGAGASILDQQIWHDQHLRLHGPIVETLEWQFGERWRDSTGDRLFDVDGFYSGRNWFAGQVIFSSSRAFSGAGTTPLPLPTPAPPVTGAASRVQMWRTIPLRDSRTGRPFLRGEFTVMAGIANAVAQSRELIWMFDQYFWSRPLARLLNARLQAVPDLHVIVVLPPHADSSASYQHRARALALADLTAGLTKTGSDYDRVGVYDLWLDRAAEPDFSSNRGIYVHAKSHTYDGDLLVCGSANLNRRSFTCDTEIACAVLDPAVVSAHQAELWAFLFPGSTFPAVDLSAAGSGKTFFDAFRAAAQSAHAHVISDPWEAATPTLPNGRPRDQSPWSALYGFYYDDLLDPTSLTLDVEDRVRGDDGRLREARLNDIVTRIELVDDGSRWPYRRPYRTL